MIPPKLYECCAHRLTTASHHVCRFGCRGKNQVKLKTNVTFSTKLNLTPFVCSSVQNTSYSSYQLYAVVVSRHTGAVYGETSFGHWLDGSYSISALFFAYFRYHSIKMNNFFHDSCTKGKLCTCKKYDYMKPGCAWNQVGGSLCPFHGNVLFSLSRITQVI